MITNIHHADFDGCISGVSCMYAFGNKNLISIASAIKDVKKNIIKALNSNSEVIFLTDLSIQPEDIELFRTEIENNKIIIYDHHANEQNEEFFKSLSADTSSVLDKDICGSTLTWLKMIELFPKNKSLLDLEEIVYLSDVYDMWRIDSTDFEYAVKINDLLDYKIGYTPDQFRQRWHDNPNPSKLSKKEKKIIEIKEKRRDRNIVELEENAVVFDFEGNTILYTEASDPTDFTKHLFIQNIKNANPGERLDMTIFKYKNANQASVRIPEGSNIEDLNEFYDTFFCKGHAKAGGISIENFEKFKKNLLRLI